MSNALAEFKHTALVNALRGCQLFAGLSQQDLNSIAGITVMKCLSRGDYLFRQGDQSHGFYIVQKGSVNVHRVNSAGKEQVIHVFRPGESFAEGTLATEIGYPADARAVESSQVLQVQKSGFVALLRRHPELALKILGSMAMHLRVLVSQIEDLTLKDFETRLANWFIKQCPRPDSVQPAVIQLPMAKRILAAELGTVSETLSRTFQKFRQEKLITVKGSTVTILNPSNLRNLVRQNIGD
jgi:CRP/FNR family transcriptional regulator, dissimilatory nitrate respiration regulator